MILDSKFLVKVLEFLEKCSWGRGKVIGRLNKFGAGRYARAAIGPTVSRFSGGRFCVGIPILKVELTVLKLAVVFFGFQVLTPFVSDGRKV